MVIDAELPEQASGVLYALGGSGGGLTCYMDDGYLCYEYNLFILMRTKIRSERPLPAGRTTLTIQTVYAEVRPGGPLDVTISSGDDELRLGRKTDWAETGNGIVRGVGAKLFLAGEDAWTLFELGPVQFSPPPGGDSEEA